MNLGATGMTQKQKPSHLNGRLWKNTKFGARWKWCSQFRSITEASFTMSTHQIVKLLTRNTMLKLSVGCVMQCGTNDMHHGSEVTGGCTITMPPPSHPNLPRTSWLNIRFHKCHSPPIHWALPNVTFIYSQRWKCCWRGIGFKTEEIKRNTQCRSWLLQRGTSKSTLDNGRTTGTSVLCLKGPALKEIRTATS